MGRFRSGSRVELEPEPFSKKGNPTRFGTRKLVPEPVPIILMGTGTLCEAGLDSVPSMVPGLDPNTCIFPFKKAIMLFHISIGSPAKQM